MTIVNPVNTGLLGFFVFFILSVMGIYPRYTVAGLLASILLAASQTITNAWFPIVCQDIDSSGCYFLTSGNQTVQVLSIAGVVVVAVKLLLATMT